MERTLFTLLAAVLEYPSERIAERTREAAEVLGQVNPAAVRSLDRFESYCRSNPLSRLQELYTETFDLQPACTPYVGYHLFGEDRVRGMFMVRLKEHYRGRIECGQELPDHITLMLRALDFEEGSEETGDLKQYCLIPALKKMIDLFKDKSNPYRGVLETVLLTLDRESGSAATGRNTV